MSGDTLSPIRVENGGLDQTSTGIPLELGQIMGGPHPGYSLGSLYVHLRWQKVGLIERTGLDIDQPGQKLFIDIEETGSAVTAKEPSTMFR
jgi:hypothetical protein